MERDAAVRVELLRRFVEDGRAPTYLEVGEALGLPEREAAESFRRLAEQRAIVLKPGTLGVWMANPFSAVETPYRVDTPDGSFHGNCAWDALGILALLGTDGTVTTACADCGEPLELRVAGGELQAEGVAHFLVPASHWWDDIGHT